MKLPRDISGKDLIKTLSRLDYQVTRQTGSHIRLTTQRNGKHSITIPAHDPIKLGTLNGILRGIGEHHKLDRDRLIVILFE
ncbi:type II toxin-antitoxin system HicA family toxin [Waterburya agarophytonicola K14]|uniref:Type II toxin-antitoxin system HicA family toxin n=1 Tax=Waterburya agarophytonicola KI4 TaxID=2874699 RepID=A0A964BS48_9CYAN|nr:type II toxin-antitoxin system HicA family toxin [Waterburya agarophytonicola KI4]